MPGTSLGTVKPMSISIIFIGIEHFLPLIEDLIVLLFQLTNKRFLTIQMYFFFRE